MYYNSKVQIALFYSKLDVRADKLFYRLNEAIDEVLDNAPINIPTPQNMTGDIPQLQAVSSNNLYTLQITGQRIDLVLNNNFVNDTANTNALKFEDIATKFVKYISDNHNIVRFGLVSTTIVDNGKSVDSIKKKYFKEVIDKPVDLSLRYNNKMKRDKYLLNNIVEVSSAYANVNGNQKKVVVIMRDINNDAQQGQTLRKNFISESLSSFYNDLLPERVKELL